MVIPDTLVGYSPMLHAPPLVSRATTGITPRKAMNVLDPFRLRREQLRGSNSNTGKKDQT